MDVWTPVQGQILRLISESINSVNSNTVAVMKGRIVGHVPFNLAGPSYLTVVEKRCEQSFCWIWASNTVCLWTKALY